MTRMINSSVVRPASGTRRADANQTATHFGLHSQAMAVVGLEEVGMLETVRADEQAARLLAEADSRRYRFLAKAIPQIIWTAMPDGRLDSFNPRWAEYTGLATNRDHDHDWTNTLHPDDIRRWVEGWTRARGQNTTLTIDLRLRRADGTYRWHLARALPVLDRPGHEIKKWLGTCTDIDDQKRAEGMLGFLAEVSTVLASSLDYETTLAAVARLAVPHVADWCVVDIAEPDGSIRRLAVEHADPALVDLGRELGRRFPPAADDEAGVAAVLRTGCPEVVAVIEPSRLARSSRSAAHLEMLQALQQTSSIAAPLIARGRTIGVISFAMAESGRAYSAVDLPLVEDLARRAALAVDNARLYREAQQARAEAEAANRAKDRFLAVLGHELRTPLTPVLAEVSAMLDDPSTPAPFRAVLEMTRRNVELEARLIDDLLDLSRIARGKLRLRRERVDLHPVVEQALAICHPGIAEAGLTVAVELAATRHHVEADPAKLQQILWNLIKNATKFTPPGGTITVRTRDEGADEVAVDVIDTGAGITPDAIARIFAPFDQGDPSVTRRFGGLGLGLAIGRSLAEAHEGRLKAASPGPGLGSTFTLELPTRPDLVPELNPANLPPVIGPADQAADTPPPPPTLRLLLVEDDADTRRVLARLLRGKGHHVATAGGIAEAVALAEQESFDLLIADLGLPDGSGHDLLHQLGDRRPPAAIALSGSGMDEDLNRSRAAGFAIHLTKPIDFATLEAALHQIMATVNIKNPFTL